MSAGNRTRAEGRACTSLCNVVRNGSSGGSNVAGADGEDCLEVIGGYYYFDSRLRPFDAGRIQI
jgi:hypothetical protein